MGRLFWKFFLSIWLAQVIAALCIGVVFWARHNEHERRNEGIDVGPPAQFVLDSAEVAFRYGGLPALRELLGQNRRERVFALDEQGKDLLGRPVEPDTLQHLKNLMEQNGATGATRRITTSDGAAWMLYVARRPPPEFRGERPPGDGPPGRPGPPSRPLFPVMPTVLTLLASLVSAIALAWHFAKPIRRLRSAFDAAASGNLAARVGSNMGRRRDELTDLGRDFDRMAGQLQTLVEGQRRLLHDVSHELRSPLARLQVAIGLARQRPEKLDASLDRIERESARMNALIGSLLTLSRIDSGAADMMDEDVNVSDLVTDIASDARFEARAANKDVVLAVVNAPPVIRGRAELLHSAIENVVRNAVHYTAPQTSVDITVALAAKADALLITVRDHGPGVPEMELESIFRPFVQSANPATPSEGYGLGLAIARQVVAAHGGDIRASNADGGGLLVGIRLPLNAAP